MVILDIMLPKRDGKTVCRNIRSTGISIPILMLTAKDTVDDKIIGLDSGADDYLVKPFSFEELLSRVRALGRRARTTVSPTLAVSTLTLNPSTQEAYIENKKINLTLKEFRILEFFMTHPNHVLTRQKIIDHLWDFNFNPFSRVVDVHINNLRNKLEKYKHGPTLETIRGVGYRLRS